MGNANALTIDAHYQKCKSVLVWLVIVIVHSRRVTKICVHIGSTMRTHWLRTMPHWVRLIDGIIADP